jgi:microcin C transport system permease protein
MMRLSPQTRRQLKRFRSIRRGYGSFLILCLFALAAVFAELLVSNRALVVRYHGHFFLPTYGAIHTGRDFGYANEDEVDYRKLAADLAASKDGDWVLLPPIPYDPLEDCYPGDTFKPRPPDFGHRHFLGTDQINRDVLARLLYGFRNSLIFASGFVVLTYLIGVSLGCAMGYWGGRFDLGAQRFIEIWSLLPFLLVVIIVRAALPPGLGFGIGVLLGIVVLFSLTSMTYYMRSATYREKARDYVAAAQVLGAGTGRILFRHIIPNILSTLVTFLPFSAAAAISALTALDYLGFGLPPPMPSWGELLKQGTSNLDAPWIVTSAFGALSLALVLITFVGEAIREAFDPKKFTYYR